MDLKSKLLRLRQEIVEENGEGDINKSILYLVTLIKFGITDAEIEAMMQDEKEELPNYGGTANESN